MVNEEQSSAWQWKLRGRLTLQSGREAWSKSNEQELVALALNSRSDGPAGVAISESVILLPNSSADVQIEAQ